MPEFIQQASDDQMAMVLCIAAVALCGLIMHFSHYVGRLSGHIRLHDARTDVSRSAQPAHPSLTAPPVVHDRAA